MLRERDDGGGLPAEVDHLVRLGRIRVPGRLHTHNFKPYRTLIRRAGWRAAPSALVRCPGCRSMPTPASTPRCLSPIPAPVRLQGKNQRRRTVMSRVIVIEFVSLDGVMHDPDGSEGSRQGGWAFRYGPEAVAGDKFGLARCSTPAPCCSAAVPGSYSPRSG